MLYNFNTDKHDLFVPHCIKFTFCEHIERGIAIKQHFSNQGYIGAKFANLEINISVIPLLLYVLT